MRLSEYLAQAGLRQRALAERLAVSEATVSRWVSGRDMPSGRRLADLERLTQGAVTAADFVPPPVPDPAMAARVDRVFRPARKAPAPARERALEPRPGHAPPGLAETQARFAAEAEALGLDAAAIAGRAVQDAIRAEKARRWLEENKDAIEAWNRWTESNELPLAEYRMF